MVYKGIQGCAITVKTASPLFRVIDAQKSMKIVDVTVDDGRSIYRKLRMNSTSFCNFTFISWNRHRILNTHVMCHLL